MNLLSPNCGKMLTVPEQYAGQLMKCPLCSGTFSVPALPAGGGLDAPAPPQPAFPQSSAPDPYHLQQAAPPEPAFTASREPAVKNEPAPKPLPEPAFQAPPPPPPMTSAGPSQPPPLVVPGDYHHRVSVPANEKVLQWVPVGAMAVVFI